MKKISTILTLLVFTSIFSQVPSYVPTDGLVGYWPFNGNANDVSGNANNGSVNGATLTIDRFGSLNSACKFEDLSNNLLVNNLQPSLSNVSLSVSLWLKLTQWQYSTLALIKNGVPYTNGFGVFIDQNNFVYGTNNYQVQFVVGNYVAARFITNQAELGLWSNIVSTYDGNNIKIYLNGVLKASQPFNQSLNSPNGNLTIGAWDNLTNPTIFNRQLDDIGIWNRALTPAEITGLYNATNSNECQSLVINTGILSFDPVTYNNTVTIYPNPANDKITIDCGTIANVTGYTIKIVNTLGQEVFSGAMNTQQYVVPLNTWGGSGVYFVKIYNAANNLLNTKKIILQ